MSISTFKLSMKKSTRFYEKNKDQIINLFTNSDGIVSIELDSNALAKLFDTYAGIDYVMVNKAFMKLYGVAARVNFSMKTKGMLTIRYKRLSGARTEYEKRLSSIKNDDSLYPNITMQMDADRNENLLGGIILKTKDLYGYLESNIDDVRAKYTDICQEGNQYLAIPYEVIRDQFGIRCRVI